MRNPVQTVFFSWTSALTEHFPLLGARLLDRPIRSLVGSALLSAFFARRNRSQLRKVRGFRRFLVHPDSHIGDAIMSQSAVSALHDFFPDAEIDIVANRAVMPLIEGNPEVRRFFPMYAGGMFPTDSELAAVTDLMRREQYDLCININPFLKGSKIAKETQPVFDFTSHAPTMTRNEDTSTEINHIVFQYHRFVHALLGEGGRPGRERRFEGVSVGLSDKALEEAARFMGKTRSSRLVVTLNTDTASPYTRIPFATQVDLAKALLERGASLLVGAGHNEAGIGYRLLEALPPSLRSQARVIPAEMSLETYSALTDHCDLFVTGDTGPMHIAAARKYSRTGRHSVRNRTALLCLFGATPSRMSGYDSFQPGYLPSNQDAPSWTMTAGSPCRNITCINKLFKTCKTVRCFERLDLRGVTDLVALLFDRSRDGRSLLNEKVGRQVDNRG